MHQQPKHNPQFLHFPLINSPPHSGHSVSSSSSLSLHLWPEHPQHSIFAPLSTIFSQAEWVPSEPWTKGFKSSITFILDYQWIFRTLRIWAKDGYIPIFVFLFFGQSKDIQHNYIYEQMPEMKHLPLFFWKNIRHIFMIRERCGYFQRCAKRQAQIPNCRSAYRDAHLLEFWAIRMIQENPAVLRIPEAWVFWCLLSP